MLDLEARTRRSNLRLVNLPEGAEGEDAGAFLKLAARGSEPGAVTHRSDSGESESGRTEEFIKYCCTKDSYHEVLKSQG